MKKTFPRVRELLQAEVSKFNSVNKVSIKTGLTNNTIGKYLEGISEPQQETLEKLSEYFKKPVAWLRGETDDESVKISVKNLADRLSVKPEEAIARLRQIGVDVGSAFAFSSRRIPVISGVEGGTDCSICWEDAYPLGQGYDTVECPPDLSDDRAYALRVHGDSMYPKYSEGTIVYVSPSIEIVSGNCVVVKLKNDGVMVKKVKLQGDTVLLESFNQAYETLILHRNEIEFMSKVTHTKEP